VDSCLFQLCFHPCANRSISRWLSHGSWVIITIYYEIAQKRQPEIITRRTIVITSFDVHIISNHADRRIIISHYYCLLSLAAAILLGS
jgi:hypothetical protein